MVLTTISRQVIRNLPKLRNELERLSALTAGTATGIGAAPGVKAFYREWISKQDWKNPYKTKKGKGELLLDSETDNTFNEAHSPSSDLPDSYRRTGKYPYRSGYGIYGSKYRKRGKRRFHHKGCVCRNVASKSKQFRSQYRHS